MLEMLAARAAKTAVYHRLAIAAEGPKIPLSFAAVIFLIALALLPVAWWKSGRERDQWWRDQISASSAEVRAAVEVGSKEAVATDAEIIKALRDSDAKRIQAEKDLRKASTPVDGCPALPARCYGVR